MRATYLSMILALIAGAQDEALDRRQQAILNGSQTLVTVSPNRPVYLPGEEIEALVRVTNATTKRLEVLQPFARGNGVLYLQEKRNALARRAGEEYGDMDPHQYHGEISGAFDTLKPGEIVEKFYDREYLDYSGTPVLVAPTRPGEYRVTFFYNRVVGTPFAVEGRVEHWTYATHHRPVLVMDGGERVAVPSYVFAMVFRRGGDRIVCISLVDTEGGSPDLYVDAESGSSDIGSVAPIRRVATADGGVSDFKLQILNNDNLRLTWKDGSGARLVELDKKRRILR